MLQSTSPRAGFAERYLEGSPRARSSSQRGSLSPKQLSLPKTVPTGRAAPDSQVLCPPLSSLMSGSTYLVSAACLVRDMEDRQLMLLALVNRHARWTRQVTSLLCRCTIRAPLSSRA